jgi:hypothetical protein
VAAVGGNANCIVTKSEKDFFSAGGRFVALWFNPDFTPNWVDGKSVCYDDAVHEVGDPAKPAAAAQGCHVITVEARKTETTETKPAEADSASHSMSRDTGQR